MKKTTQFITSAVLAFVGMVLLTFPRFTAAADTLSSYGQTFTILTIVGLILMMIAAIWFYWLSFR